MRRLFLTLLFAALVGATPGCLSMANTHALWSRPDIEQPSGRDVAIKIVKIDAFAHPSDEIHWVAVYADGAEVSATMRENGPSFRSGAAGIRYAPGLVPRPPVHRPGANILRIPVQHDPIWEGDGVSLTPGDTIRWIKSGKVVASYNLRRSNWVSSDPFRQASSLARRFYFGLHLLLVPFAAALDLVTWPFQLLALSHL